MGRRTSISRNYVRPSELALRVLFLMFRNSTQLYPHIYFDHFLVQKAQMLLQASPASIKEVAYLLGFQNESHFCKTFRNLVGVTPNRYRHIETAGSSPNSKIHDLL